MKNNSQMITARQGNRIMILEIFSAAAMFLPQIALQKSYHSGIVVVVMASVMAGIYLWIVDHAARGVSIENVLKRYRFAAIIYYVRFLLNGAFFYLCILYLTKKYLLPDKSTFFIGFPLLLLAYQMTLYCLIIFSNYVGLLSFVWNLNSPYDKYIMFPLV